MMYFLKRLRLRAIWSWRGLARTWESEHSFRTWVWANLVSAAAALGLPISLAE